MTGLTAKEDPIQVAILEMILSKECKQLLYHLEDQRIQ